MNPVAEPAPSISQSHVSRPRLPAWAINLIITGVIVALYPLNRVMEGYMDPYFLRIVVLIGINVILATSLNLVNGITGQFSLGHAGFMAIGAYTAAFLSGAGGPLGRLYTDPVMANVGLALGLVAAGSLAALAGYVVGLPSLRLKGDYLAIVTLGF